MNRRRWPGRPPFNRVLATLAVIATATIVPQPPAAYAADDSLRSALEAISDKIGETQPPPRLVYLSPGDGQPEDIGYGYQKNLRNLENMFEMGAAAGGKTSRDEMVEKFLDYLTKEDGGGDPEPELQYYHAKRPSSKKSIFREREDQDVPDNLQQLKYDRYGAAVPPSAFRERYKSGGRTPLVQDRKNDDPDDYLYAVDSLLDPYIQDNVQGMSDNQLEELLRRAQEDKREYAPPAAEDDEYDAPPSSPRQRDLRYYEPGFKRAAAAKRQLLFIPMSFPRYKQTRVAHNKHHNNRWTMKPRPVKRSNNKDAAEAAAATAQSGGTTDPKVAAELDDIFLGSDANNGSNRAAVANANVTAGEETPPPPKSVDDDGRIELKKKSIDWTNYFGYDRKKKSIDSIPSDDTILNQYMRTYGKETEDNEANTINTLQNNRLMWLEDALINDALKYTGANQGTNDPEDINNVKNQVLSNLNQAYNIEKLIQNKARQENNDMLEKQHYEKSDFAIHSGNNSQPMNFLDTTEQHTEANHKECTQLLQITQDCLDLGGSAGDLMLPVCTLYRVCRTCESEQSECEQRFVQSSHELCSRAPLCRYFSRRMLQLMQDRPLQMECHKCMINFLQNED